MGDVIALGAVPDVDDSLSALLDLKRCLEAGEDLGSRVAHIRKAAAAMRAQTGGLRRLLEAPDEILAAEPEILASGEKVLALAERNLAKVEELLRLAEEVAS